VKSAGDPRFFAEHRWVLLFAEPKVALGVETFDLVAGRSHTPEEICRKFVRSHDAPDGRIGGAASAQQAQRY
jgi:hypothetical protein